MDVQNAQQTALQELYRRDVETSTIHSYMHYGNQLISQLRARSLPISYAGLCRLARVRRIRLSTLEQRRTHLRYALAVSLLADADELEPDEFDAIADGLANLRARHGANDPDKKAFRDARDLIEGGPKDASETTRAARKRKYKRDEGDVARLAIGPAQVHAEKRGYDDWRADIVDHARTDKDRGMLRVQAVTGCRPIEMLWGISVTIIDDGALEFSIHGAKVKTDETDSKGRFVEHGRRGQPQRMFALEPTGARLFNELREQVEAAGGIGVTCVYTLAGTTQNPVKDYCLRVIRLANRLGYDGVSAYSLRHQFASDLKAARVTTDDRAAAMGHRSNRSQQVYGQSQTGRGGLIELAHVQADRPIRDRAPGETMENTITRPEPANDDERPDREPDDHPGMA